MTRHNEETIGDACVQSNVVRVDFKLGQFARKLRPHVESKLAAEILATVADLADDNMERFKILVRNGVAPDAASSLLRECGYLLPDSATARSVTGGLS